MKPVAAIEAAESTARAYRHALRKHTGVKAVVTTTYQGDRAAFETLVLSPEVESFDTLVMADHPSWIDYFFSNDLPIGSCVVQTIEADGSTHWKLL